MTFRIGAARTACRRACLRRVTRTSSPSPNRYRTAPTCRAFPACSRRRVARAIQANRAARAAVPEHLAHHDPDLAARDVLRTALLALPYRQREAIVLHYLADLPVAQIAADLRLPPSTVKTRLAAGRRRLERELADDTQEVLDER
jgi:RNA polymerase sigma factor (sigma-70 family)